MLCNKCLELMFLNINRKSEKMPPKIQITEERILEEAVRIIEKDGVNALNARSLAKALGCSVQPLFRAFANMEDLKLKATAIIAQEYQQYLLNGMSCANPLSGLLLAYVRYAQEKKNFFKLLHMSDRLGLHETQEIALSGVNKQIVDAMAEIEGLPQEKAQTLYLGSFFAAHGIASLLATNHCNFTEDMIMQIITDVYEGLILKLS